MTALGVCHAPFRLGHTNPRDLKPTVAGFLLRRTFGEDGPALLLCMVYVLVRHGIQGQTGASAAHETSVTEKRRDLCHAFFTKFRIVPE